MISRIKASQKQGHKFCSKCQLILPQTDFYATGGYCRSCQQFYVKKKHRTLEGHALQAYWHQHNPGYSKQEFLDWILNQTDYPKLFADWVASGFQRKFAPTVYRTDPREGFNFHNLNVSPWQIARNSLSIRGVA